TTTLGNMLGVPVISVPVAPEFRRMLVSSGCGLLPKVKMIEAFATRQIANRRTADRTAFVMIPPKSILLLDLRLSVESLRYRPVEARIDDLTASMLNRLSSIGRCESCIHGTHYLRAR